MGLFEKKKVTAEQVAKLIEQLSDEEREKLIEHLSGEEQPEEAAEEKPEEVAEETEAGEEQPEADTEPTEEAAEEHEEAAEETPEEEPDKQTAENRDEVIQGLTERISALEETLKEFSTLKEKMEEYTKKQADSFGLGGKSVGGVSKDMKDLSADELKNRILSGQN